MIVSRCGCPCDTCEFHLDGRCAGCIALSGVPFHDTKVCRLADCCQKRGYLHCGQCPEFPCGELVQFSYDEQYGDNPPGARIDRVREWTKAET